MSDARALLRAHRAANRIEHPHAAYSDAGKLLCKICRETVKSESLWETHIHSPAHRQKSAAQQGPEYSNEIPSKRKHDDVDDMDMEQGEAPTEAEDAVRKKRSKTDMISPVLTSAIEKENAATPPRLTRRPSSTPAQGVEISIPSRPATPLIGEGSATSTPNLTSLGRSPLIGFGSENSGTPNTNGSTGMPQIPISTESLAVPQPLRLAGSAPTPANVDEAEWAAFEAEIEAAEAPAAAASSTNPNGVYADAVISAPALTADELASKSLDEENSRRKYHLDAEIADEKEDATRALEAEFEEMEELESRVRKLKERREQLRKGSVANLNGAAQATAAAAATKRALGKENAGAAKDGTQDAESDEDDEDDEDWDDGFRFRA